jgi:hypothetical protein
MPWTLVSRSQWHHRLRNQTLRSLQEMVAEPAGELRHLKYLSVTDLLSGFGR